MRTDQKSSRRGKSVSRLSARQGLRARNSELSIPPDVCRIASNAPSAAARVGKKSSFSFPLRRESVVVSKFEANCS